MSAEPGARGDDAESYARALRTVLDTESERVAAALGDLHRAAVEAENGVEAILIDVFVDQDGEGPFDVWARFEGADAFALDRRLDEQRHLFGVEWTADGWEPAVPSRPRRWTRDRLEEAVLVIVAEWIEGLLPADAKEGLFWVGAPDLGYA
ncbi:MULTISPECIES: DUF6389 family protein [unclassified Microbacterium]|uniref:DUF6389 family protein n=1 Tax=unclassified Microbacterium TaxID=2609290 RepID=UPI00165711E8|nr:MULTISPECIES: DUF6389 family protein [unclassified Microbacterium]MCT1365880.1 DUF6389 family protein [Microbacterium sp. p3-SID131]MCT1376867.1 DUF6389 family protein [Microbacterium sp. p3-SID337]MDH5131446.1 DUF6389 family protein [Microbacterium sp. RD10]MDH5135275.1 DUF6389 family protein [Microbacterium sp. RD11]MDH5143585.1 DUF6389 family protein [Microbacterium sp. RD12]